MESNKIYKLSLIRTPEFRLDLSRLKWNLFVKNPNFEEISESSISDGNKKKLFKDFFFIEIIDESCLFDTFPEWKKEEEVKNINGKIKIIFEGDLSRVDFLGFKNDGMNFFINGDVGNYLGCMMKNGSIMVAGSAGHYVGSMMNGGVLLVKQNVGHYAGSNLPGEMEGMSGGKLLIKGNAGQNFCRRMRRGFAFVFGDVGDYFASDMIAGTAFVNGLAGQFWGYGMRRGTIIFVKDQLISRPVFKETHYDFSSYWGVLRPTIRSLDRSFESLVEQQPKRFVGDLAFGGKGECLFLQKKN